MLSDRPQCKIPLIFFRTDAGNEPVRDWLKGLPEAERQETGQDLLRAQWRWPVGMPLPSDERWTVGDPNRPASQRTARVLLSHYRGHLVALHGFIKKTRAMPDDDLALARKRKQELER